MFKEFVEHVATSLVDNPDAVYVNEVMDEGVTVIELSVAESDAGRMIGRNGRVINAVRTILQAMAEEAGKQVSIEVN